MTVIEHILKFASSDKRGMANTNDFTLRVNHLPDNSLSNMRKFHLKNPIIDDACDIYIHEGEYYLDITNYEKPNDIYYLNPSGWLINYRNTLIKFFFGRNFRDSFTDLFEANCPRINTFLSKATKKELEIVTLHSDIISVRQKDLKIILVKIKNPTFVFHHFLNGLFIDIELPIGRETYKHDALRSIKVIGHVLGHEEQINSKIKLVHMDEDKILKEYFSPTELHQNSQYYNAFNRSGSFLHGITAQDSVPDEISGEIFAAIVTLQEIDAFARSTSVGWLLGHTLKDIPDLIIEGLADVADLLRECYATIENKNGNKDLLAKCHHHICDYVKNIIDYYWACIEKNDESAELWGHAIIGVFEKYKNTSIYKKFSGNKDISYSIKSNTLADVIRSYW